MIGIEVFKDAVENESVLNRQIRRDPGQNQAVSAEPDQSAYIIAGPGSGKTTAMALRVLKLIFVNNVNPKKVLVTTFTRKAAAELSSRIFGWGDTLKQHFLDTINDEDTRNWLETIDFNQITLGTLDSIAEEIIGTYREPGDTAPVVINNFTSKGLMLKVGLFEHNRHNSSTLRQCVGRLYGKSSPNTKDLVDALIEIKDRFYHDQIERDRYLAECQNPGAEEICCAIADYERHLDEKLLYDYAKLESVFLRKLRDGSLEEFLNKIEFVLVDEYQDTNLLQDQIYFELAQAALSRSGSITIVGDDDQSIYRFRGATVELFYGFPEEFERRFHIRPLIINLQNNYRSTENIVNFVSNFIQLDESYQSARVPQKEQIRSARALERYYNFPVFGLFRENLDTLAEDLADFINQIVNESGYTVSDCEHEYCIERSIDRGTPVDVCVLCSTPKELNTGDKPRLPRLLRDQLSRLPNPIRVFNPRGTPIQEVPDIMVLCGLILECIDPNSFVQNSITNLPRNVPSTLNSWRDQAHSLINQNPISPTGASLGNFVAAWQQRSKLNGRPVERATNVALNDLIFKLITWLPSFQIDIENLVYLEAITRSTNDSVLFSSYGSEIIFESEHPATDRAFFSVQEIIWNILVPIATGVVELDEELFETLPEDRINIMSIHQAKGLEFPLVIVDVGSDFRIDHWKQRKYRFPDRPSNTSNLEDELRCFSPMSANEREGIDCDFDDLIRKFFVAFSRAQDVLVLVGLNRSRYRNGKRNDICNIALGWDRDGNWMWGDGLPLLTHIERGGN